ncbi:MAG TPA: shikimate kinase, partial [Parachlamydiaceae bacterium]|nr:shikimate kinase [Parachlamydiaceae bacterium]
EYHLRFRIQTTPREITLKEGESFFRKLENEAVKSLADVKNSLIAIGGGTLCLPENIELLRNLGWLVYLKTPSELLLERLMNRSKLPSYIEPENAGHSFKQLLNQRLPLYEQNCHYCIDTSSENVLEIISNSALKEKYHGK